MLFVVFCRLHLKHFLDDMRAVVEYTAVCEALLQYRNTIQPFDGWNFDKALNEGACITSVDDFVASRLVGRGARRNVVAHHYLLTVCVVILDGVPEFVCEELESADEGQAIRALSTRVQGTFDSVQHRIQQLTTLQGAIL